MQRTNYMQIRNKTVLAARSHSANMLKRIVNRAVDVIVHRRLAQTNNLLYNMSN